MTRHSRVLDAIEPGPCILINPEDLKSFSLKSGDVLVVESRRGKISATTRVDEGMQKGVVMMPFSFNEAAANLITNEALDPFGKIPEFKYCAVKLSRGQRPGDAVFDSGRRRGRDLPAQRQSAGESDSDKQWQRPGQDLPVQRQNAGGAGCK